MLVAQISDLHMAPEGALTFGHVDSAGALARVVAHVNGLTPRPDLAVITGDITNDGSAAEARQARAVLEGLECPYLVLPGNHDRRQVLAEVFGPERVQRSAGGFLNFAHDLGGVRLLGLDSLDEGRPGGAFGAQRARWLAAALEAAPGPVMLFMHHPPLPLGVPETDQDGFAGAEALAAQVAAHGRVLRIAAGHVHLATTSAWQGVPVVTAPAIAMQLTRDFSAAPPPSGFTLSAPGYLLHHLTGAGVLVSHVVTLGDEEVFPFAPIGGGEGGNV